MPTVALRRAAAARLPRKASLPAGIRWSSTPPRVPWSTKELDKWAKSDAVRGHAHCRPGHEPYSFSRVRKLGGGVAIPDGWEVSMLSSSGMKGGASPNQDAFSYTWLDSGWLIAIACDGHGEYGEVISGRVSRMMPAFLSAHLDASPPGEALAVSFAEVQEDLEEGFHDAQIHSGAAVAMCCMHSDRGEVWFAHAGDSRLVLGDLASGVTVVSTEEHKAHEPEERRRIEEARGQIVTRTYDDGEVISRVYVPRTGMPGLAMSRSLGDGCLKPYGVVAIPEVHDITHHWQACSQPAVVVASDGLWDFIECEQAVSFLAERRQSGERLGPGIESLCRLSQRLWIDNQKDYCDDITIIVIASPDGT